MKRKITKLTVLILITVCCSLFTAFAQVPQAFNYQAIARDNSGNLLSNQLILVEVLIHPADSTTAAVYTENFTVNTNKFGLFTLAIGKGTTPTGVFSSIPWSTGNYWLQVKINLGSGYVNMGSSQLLTVPYAMYAANAGVPGVTGATGPTGAASTVAGPTGATGATGIGIAGGSKGEIQFDSSGAFAGNANLFWDNTNKYLGIGTTSPGKFLDINAGALSTSAARIISSGNDAALALKNIGSGGRTYWLDAGSGTAGVGQGNFTIWDNNSGAARLAIDSNGWVGIGTTRPPHQLQIQGTYGNSCVGFTSTTTGTGVDNGFVLGLNTPTGDALVWNFSAQPIMFGTNGAERMRIDAAGNVGIGTTTPAASLDVNGSIVNNNKTGAANLVPIAYGNITDAATGALQTAATTSNVTLSIHTASSGIYLYTIAGETIDLTSYVCIATLNGYPGSITWSTGIGVNAGKLYITTYNTSGTPTDSGFSFVVYKK